MVVIENTQSSPRLPDPRAVRALYHNNCLKINYCTLYLCLISNSFRLNAQIGAYPPQVTELELSQTGAGTGSVGVIT